MGFRGLAAAVLLDALAGCGQESSSPATPVGSPSADPDVVLEAPLTGPPPLTLLRPEGEVDLPAYAWCFWADGVGGCGDGPSPRNPPQTSAADPLTFSFPLEDWTFTASFGPRGEPTDCERVVQTDAVDQGDGTFVVPALGPAGSWEVQVSGNGASGGSLATAFTWDTGVDATTSPDARGVVGFLGPPRADTDDEELEGYGPSLLLTGLAVEPTEITAELVVTGAGASATYPLTATKDRRCPDDGTISLAGEHQTEPVDLSGLGEPPLVHEVRLTLDGDEYVGTGQWPDDLTPATSNQLALSWSPPLPTWTGTSVSPRPDPSR